MWQALGPKPREADDADESFVERDHESSALSLTVGAPLALEQQGDGMTALISEDEGESDELNRVFNHTSHVGQLPPTLDQDALNYNDIAGPGEAVRAAANAKMGRLMWRSIKSSSSSKNNNNSLSELEGSSRGIPQSCQLGKRYPSVTSTLTGVSLDEDVATIDRLIKKVSILVMTSWILLLLISYLIVPSDCIIRYTGGERSAAMVFLSIHGTVAIIRHGPIFWSREHTTATTNKTRVSGVLLGGMVTQAIASLTLVIFIFFPVPVLIDPILGSRVHFVRWCEWIPLSGFMTLQTECMDAPVFDGERLVQEWNRKIYVSWMQTLSTLCGLFFPFCHNVWVWSFVMVISCVTYSAIIFRYYEKKRGYNPIKRGGSADEIELYDRARMSLRLHGVCAFTWTLITINYFITSMGHMFVDERWALLHDPAVTMYGECLMDLVAKVLYMSLIVDAHDAAFDEGKRANRRLAELKHTMSVVWENSSDTIAISVRKMTSGDITSMVSPSFFRNALVANRRIQIQDISAVVLEHDHDALKGRRSSLTDVPNTSEMPSVGVRVVPKDDFLKVDLEEDLAQTSQSHMIPLTASLTDILARAWQNDLEEFVFEHDAILNEGETPTKYEVKVTRLEENAVVVVVRNVSERYRRFEAEKRFVYETTARQKDAEANRFQRHEVKNGLLAAIEICNNVRETVEDTNGKPAIASEINANVQELDRTLNDVLDIVVAETMARDVVQEMYVPHMVKMDANQILSQTRGFASDGQMNLVCNPSPFPILSFDQGIFKCIHGNAIRNALKYGKRCGTITTEANYDFGKEELEIRVINEPGSGHDRLVELGDRASELVFSHGTRLHANVDGTSGRRTHSAGDGAWIMKKSASVLDGTVNIVFEDNQTVFCFRAPAKLHNCSRVKTFRLPSNVWGVAIDDSKIQRKLLKRMLDHVGIKEEKQVILGANEEEISGFVDFFVDFVRERPEDRIFLLADENLEFGDLSSADHGIISGSECIKQIRSILTQNEEKRILAVARSANDSPHDIAIYRSRAHDYLPKVPLRASSVRETIAPIWEARFPIESDNESLEPPSRVASAEDLRELSLVSPIELLQELESIDQICMDRGNVEWPVLWEKLHRLMGDLKVLDTPNALSSSATVRMIEFLRGDSIPNDFMNKWIEIRSSVFSLLVQTKA